MIPGLDEVFALADIKAFADSGDYDLVVVDCAPTAETLRLLSLPDVLGWYMQRVFPAQRNVTRAIRPLLARVVNMPLAGRRGVRRGPRVLRPARRRARAAHRRRRSRARGSSSTRSAWSSPKRGARSRTSSLFGYHVDAVVANRLLPAEVVDPWFKGWKEIQAEQLERDRGRVRAGAGAHRGARGRGADRPRPARRVRGRRSTATTTRPRGCTDVEPFRVDADGDALVLSMHLPFTEKHEVELGRRNGELLVAVGPHRRAVVLPDSLRRREVGGGPARRRPPRRGLRGGLMAMRDPGTPGRNPFFDHGPDAELGRRPRPDEPRTADAARPGSDRRRRRRSGDDGDVPAGRPRRPARARPARHARRARRRAPGRAAGGDRAPGHRRARARARGEDGRRRDRSGPRRAASRARRRAPRRRRARPDRRDDPFASDEPPTLAADARECGGSISREHARASPSVSTSAARRFSARSSTRRARCSREHRVPSPDAWPEMRDAIVGVVDELRERGAEVDAVGVGAAGMVDLDGVIHYAPNVPGLPQGRRCRRRSPRRPGSRPIVDNDANTAAYAEITARRRRAGVRDALVDHARHRHRRRGDRRRAGAAGRATASRRRSATSRSTRPARCARAASRATGRRWRRATRSGGWRARRRRRATRPSVARARPAATSTRSTGTTCSAAAHAGDADALALVDQYSFNVAIGLVGLANIFDPALIAIAGGLVNDGELFLGPIRAPLPRPHRGRGVPPDAGDRPGRAGGAGRA